MYCVYKAAKGAFEKWHLKLLSSGFSLQTLSCSKQAQRLLNSAV